ncbi:fumarylacetoacetate hydrolase family protein [Ornithinimicrobium faecis]|uniref:fumarylacetoacetate hydrolase family protein n=1 Tax=Ornithinimicrobium faecis TaxID=2934158 RepID=UPI002117DAE5|nr:fumarylacetoacetate hydrolase family protein [Ornithinimicrobium sp. HY1745]
MTQWFQASVDGQPLWGREENGILLDLTPTAPWARSTGEHEGRTLPVAEARLLAPASPTKIVCAGRNSRELLREQGREPTAEPFLFLKTPNAVIATGESIRLPTGAGDVAHEGELALVIGAPMTSGMTDDQRWEAVFGFTCANDITVRDWQKSDPQWWRAKSADTLCPLGPSLVERDADWAPFSVRTLVDGEVRQEFSTDDLIFSPRELLEYISEFMTLVPGDVVLTGTSAGIKPLQAGNTVTIEIDGLGRLENPVVDVTNEMG